MVDVVTVKVLCAVGLFILGLVAALSAKFVKGNHPQFMATCNAIAGGVLIAVAVVHMLSENSEKLEGWGLSILPWLGVHCEPAAGTSPKQSARRLEEEGCEAFPIGFVLFVLGAFLIFAIETCGGGRGRGHGHGQSDGDEDKGGDRGDGHRALPVDLGKDNSDSEEGSTDTADEQSEAGGADSAAAAAVSVSTAVGVSVHSFIEAVAMGSSSDVAAFLSLIFAVVLHKWFTSFAVGSALVAQDNKLVFAVGLATYVLSAPVGIATGLLLTKMEGPFTAAAQCLAAGTLLTIGITDMLMPSVTMKDPNARRCNLLAAFAAASCMMLLAAWC